MPTPALTFEALGAGYGDALLVSCATGAATWRALIDTGPDEAWPALQARLARLRPDAQGRRAIDLAVISHVDHDHIGAARDLFSDRALNLRFGDVWFNAPPLRSRSIDEGRTLAALLRAGPTALPWNQAFGGGLAVTREPQGHAELPAAAGRPRLTLLSPTGAKLERLFQGWQRALGTLDKPARPRRKPMASRGLGLPDLAALAARKTALDAAPANGSSIAMLLEHAGRSVLLAADVHAPVLATALANLAEQRGLKLPWQVDIFKLSHHGSRANLPASLFKTVQARHYVVSTNGAVFGHPDDEAIARVIVHGGGAGRTLWFNHRNDESLRWQQLPASALRGLKVEVPQPGAAGVTIDLPAAA